MPVFTVKCFPSTGKKYSRRYQVPAETERFVWSYSVPWVLKQVETPAKQDHFQWCSASKTVNAKTFTAIGNKTEFDYSL